MTNRLKEAKRAITEACESLKTSGTIPRAIDAFQDFLLEKNKAYGNSIYEPVRVFTNASIETLILVRLNDKATRLLKGESGGEDSFDDLLGYLILRKALPLYLESKETDGCVDANSRTVPGSVVTKSLKNRGLRVGMTFQEVRDNLWTQCEADSEGSVECTEGDPCPACKFLDGALCTCGHSYMLHSETENCVGCDDGCGAFSLASWPTESLDDVAAELAAHVNANVDGWTAGHAPQPSVVFLLPSPDIQEVPGIPSQSSDVIFLPVSGPSEAINLGALTTDWPDQASPNGEPPMADTKKPRVNRATWHETTDGKHAIDSVLGFLIQQPIVSWSMGELTKKAGLDRSDVQLAIAHILSTGAIVNHGKAKGTRYAVAGFTDWPASTPRGKKQNDQCAEEEPSPIIGSNGAT